MNNFLHPWLIENGNPCTALFYLDVPGNFFCFFVFS
jgi:hypothetical protein